MWYCGRPLIFQLLDYTATKGAIVAFSRALSNQIVKGEGCPSEVSLRSSLIG